MDLTEIIQLITGLVLSVVPVVAALALLYFFWGIALFLFNIEDKEAIKKGRARMFWGLIALFVIISLGGILLLLERTFFATNLHTVPYGVGNTNTFPQNPLGNNSNNPTVPFDPLHDGSQGGGGTQTP